MGISPELKDGGDLRLLNLVRRGVLGNDESLEKSHDDAREWRVDMVGTRPTRVIRLQTCFKFKARLTELLPSLESWDVT